MDIIFAQVEGWPSALEMCPEHSTCGLADEGFTAFH